MVALDRLPTPAEMVAHLDRHVAGQPRAKRDLSVAVYRHYLGLAHRDLPGSGGLDFGRQHILLLGPTGSGKSLLAKTLCSLLNLPLAFTSATSLVGASASSFAIVAAPGRYFVRVVAHNTCATSATSTEIEVVVP